MPGTFTRTRHIYSMHQSSNMGLSIRKRVVVLSTVSMLIAATVILGSAYMFTLRVLAYQRGYDNATYVQPYVEPRKDYVFNSTTVASPRIRRQAMASPMPEPLPTPLPDVTTLPEAQRISASAGTSTLATIVGTTQVPESERRAIIAGGDEVAHGSSEEKNKSKESDEHSGEKDKRSKERSEEVAFVAPLDQIKTNGTVKEFERLRQHPKDVRLHVVESGDQEQRGVGSLEVTDRGKETSLLPSTTTTPTTTTRATTESSKSTSSQSQESKESKETDQVQRPLKSQEHVSIDNTATTVRDETQKPAGNEKVDFDHLISKFVANRDKGLLFNPEATRFDHIVEFDVENSGDSTTTTTASTTSTTALPSTSTPVSSGRTSTTIHSDVSVSSQSSTSEEQATVGGFARGAVEGSPTTEAPVTTTSTLPPTTTSQSTTHSPTLPSSEVLLARINPEGSSATLSTAASTTSAEAGSLLRTQIEQETRRLNQDQRLKNANQVINEDIVTHQPLTTGTSTASSTAVPETSTATATVTSPSSTTISPDSVVDKVKEAVSSFNSTEATSSTTTKVNSADTTTTTTTARPDEAAVPTEKSVMSKVADSISSFFGRGETTVLTTEAPRITDSIAKEVDKLQHLTTEAPVGTERVPIQTSSTTYMTTEVPPLTDRISSEINQVPHVTTEFPPLTEQIASEMHRLQQVTTQVPSSTDQSITTTKVTPSADRISSEIPDFSDRIAEEVERLQKVTTTSSTTTESPTTTSTSTESTTARLEVSTSTTQQPSSTAVHETQWYLGNLEEDHDRLKYFGARRAGGAEPTTNVPSTGSTPVPVPVTSAIPSTSVPTTSSLPIAPGAVFVSTVPPVNPLPHLVTPESASTVSPSVQSTSEILSNTFSTVTPLPHLVTPEASSTVPLVASGLPAVTPASIPSEIVTSSVPVLASGVQIATGQPSMEGATTTAVPVFASGLHAATAQPAVGIITPVSTAIPPITPAALTADNGFWTTSEPVDTTDTDYVTLTTTPGAVSPDPATANPETGLPPLPFIAPGDVLVAPQNVDHDHETQSDEPTKFHHETEELKDPQSTLPVVSKVTPNNNGNTEEAIKPSQAYPETSNAQALPLKDISAQDSHLSSTTADQVKAQATNVTQAVKNTAAHLQNEAASKWSQFKRRWADSKEFVLANTGIALFVSLLQFVSAAVLVGVVKDTMSEMKMHRWATRWIIFNWVLFIILIGCFVSFIAMGSDPEKQFGHKLVVPENETSVRPDFPGIGFYTKSISSHMYTYLMLGDIVVLFLLMVMTSYILRNHTIHHIHLEHGVHH